MYKIIKNYYNSFLWRISRLLYKKVRYENSGFLDLNGEFMILKKIINLSKYNNKYIFFDIGAFKGHWCIYLNNLSNSKSINSKIYAFEPSPYNFKYLNQKY